MQKTVFPTAALASDYMAYLTVHRIQYKFSAISSHGFVVMVY